MASPWYSPAERALTAFGEPISREQVGVRKEQAEVAGPDPGTLRLRSVADPPACVRTLPPWGLSMLARHAGSVDLPDPEGPVTATNSPRSSLSYSL